jgi:Holliday junction resolvasome RuvABC endonuclease subunit
MTRILALDLGTHCGWALSDVGSARVEHGTWDLAPSKQRRFEGGGMKWVRLRRYLDEVGVGVTHVVIEEVRRHLGVDAAHAYGGALAVVTEWCEQRGVPYQAFPVATIKKHATGKGNAKKDAMMAAATAKGWTFDDDNDADAQWILDLARSELSPTARVA